MIDGNQKMFISQLAIDNDFFHSAFVNPCMMYGAQVVTSVVDIPDEVCDLNPLTFIPPYGA
jgi:hypothetical protein